MATTEVILREKIENLGAEADVVKVKRGFARNFLLPQGKAFEATKGNLRHLEHLQEIRAKREAEELAEAENAANRLKKLRISLFLSMGEGGKAFGAITSADIVKEIGEKSRLKLDAKQIVLKKPIKTLGNYDIPVKIHPDVPAEVTIRVKPEESGDAAEEEAAE